MISASEHPQEAHRLSALFEFEILDTEDEEVFDELTQVAAVCCESKFALISLIDTHRQWFKSRVGVDIRDAPKSIAFCTHAILEKEIFEIPDTYRDERFFDNPFVVSDPHIRFYAGVPLVTEDGLPLGTLCVLDTEPKYLNPMQVNILKVLANQVMGQLTLRLQHKKLKKLSREKDQIYSVISHDLRNPFTGVLGVSKNLQKTAKSANREKIEKMAKTIHESGLRVYQIFEELIEWTQTHKEKSHCQFSSQPLYPLIENNWLLLKDMIERKGITFSEQIDPNTTVFADDILTSSIIRNLLINAIKFTPEHGSINISAVEHVDSVEISVSDTGVGMKPIDFKNMVFMTKNSQTGTNGEKGYGFGLLICKQFVDMQGGHIWFDSKYNLGTRIGFTLPK